MVSGEHTEPGIAPRVALQDVVRILDLMARKPGLRGEPLPGDVEGDFDEWFDGGAVRYVTGVTEYAFSDGTSARTPTLPTLHVHIRFPGDQVVSVSQGR